MYFEPPRDPAIGHTASIFDLDRELRYFRTSSVFPEFPPRRVDTSSTRDFVSSFGKLIITVIDYSEYFGVWIKMSL